MLPIDLSISFCSHSHENVIRPVPAGRKRNKTPTAGLKRYTAVAQLLRGCSCYFSLCSVTPLLFYLPSVPATSLNCFTVILFHSVTAMLFESAASFHSLEN